MFRPDRQTLLTVVAATFMRDAGVDGGLAGGDLAGAGLEHLAHEDVVDLLGREAGPLERALDGEAAQVGGGEAGERTGQLADRACGPRRR